MQEAGTHPEEHQSVRRSREMRQHGLCEDAIFVLSQGGLCVVCQHVFRSSLNLIAH
jgi:hypothetical protein